VPSVKKDYSDATTLKILGSYHTLLINADYSMQQMTPHASAY